MQHKFLSSFVDSNIKLNLISNSPNACSRRSRRRIGQLVFLSKVWFSSCTACPPALNPKRVAEAKSNKTPNWISAVVLWKVAKFWNSDRFWKTTQCWNAKNGVVFNVNHLLVCRLTWITFKSLTTCLLVFNVFKSEIERISFSQYF